MNNLLKLPYEITQHVFLFLETEDILLVRLVCKYFSYGLHNKLFWRNQFKLLNIFNNSIRITNEIFCGNTMNNVKCRTKCVESKYWSPNIKDKYVTEIVLSGTNDPIDRDTITKILENLHNFPNLVHISLRHLDNLPKNTLDYLSIIKNLMFLDMYETNITYDLTSDKVKNFLDKCSKKLIEIDLEHLFGFRFDIIENGKSVISCRKHDYDNGNVNFEDYPYIKTWGKCGYEITKIREYMILSKTKNYFNNDSKK